jgi:hypothetical protein
MAEQLQQDNLNLRLKRGAGHNAGRPPQEALSLEDEVGVLREELAQTQEQLARYKARTSLILRHRRPAWCTETPSIHLLC